MKWNSASKLTDTADKNISNDMDEEEFEKILFYFMVYIMDEKQN